VFAIMSEKLFVPLTLALLGIVLRGAAFAFRGPAYRDLLPYKVWGVIFGIASIATPFFFGACVAGIATGTFNWHGAMSLAVGLFAITLCAQLAAVYLTAETLGALRDDFTRRAYIATLAVAGAGLLALIVARFTERTLVTQLFMPAPIAIIAVAMVLGLVVLALLRLGRVLWARFAVAAEVAAVLCAWFVAQAPYVQAELGVTQPAAPNVTLTVFLWATAIGAIVLIPSLWLLFAVFKREPLSEHF
jgi:cytochrome d ubiquinol oxidase subunit II